MLHTHYLIISLSTHCYPLSLFNLSEIEEYAEYLGMNLTRDS